jgi:hypothetical protein
MQMMSMMLLLWCCLRQPEGMGDVLEVIGAAALHIGGKEPLIAPVGIAVSAQPAAKNG